MPFSLCTLGEDTDIVLWDLGSAQVIKKMRGHTDVINSLSFSSDGNVLVSGSADKTVRLWSVKDAETGEPSRLLADQARPRSDPNELGVFATKKTPIFRVAFSRRNLALALGVFSG